MPHPMTFTSMDTACFNHTSFVFPLSNGRICPCVAYESYIRYTGRRDVLIADRILHFTHQGCSTCVVFKWFMLRSSTWCRVLVSIAMSGGNAARSARRKLAAIRSGRLPGRRGRGCHFRKKDAGDASGAKNRRGSTSRSVATRGQPVNSKLVQRLRDKITYHRLALFECPAESDSNLSACVARFGGAAVRVSKPDGPDPNMPGPTPVRGRAVTWLLDLHHPSASKRVSKYLDRWKPRHVWLSVPCTSRTQMQYINVRNFVDGRPQGEKKQRRLLGKARTWAKAQRRRQPDGIHSEQSAKSHEPYDSANKPWVICRTYPAASVRGCSVGLREHRGQRRLQSKAWSVESSHDHLLAALRKLKCTCPVGYVHGRCIGAEATLSGRYTAEFANIVIGILWPSTMGFLA